MWLRRLVRLLSDAKIYDRLSVRRLFLISQKGNGTYTSKKLFLVAPTVMGLWGLVGPKNDKQKFITKKEVLLAKADALFHQERYDSIYELLSSYKDSGDAEILWRLSRALYKMSLAASDVEAKRMILEAYDIISTALSIQEDNYAVHKWMSIILDSKSGHEGMRSRIQQLHNVKKHMLRALELKPNDATTLYMLGHWCYQISNLAWYQRKLASVIFGEPPKSSFEEALMYFKKAEEVEPNFYSYNLLMIAKTYEKLGRKEDALRYLRLTSEFPAKSDEDHEAKKEALKLLDTL